MSLRRAVADGQDDRVAAGAGGTEGAARPTPVLELIVIPSGRLVARVRERVARVGVGRVGVEADDARLRRRCGRRTRCVNTGATLGSVTVQVNESVSVSVPSLTVSTTA